MDHIRDAQIRGALNDLTGANSQALLRRPNRNLGSALNRSMRQFANDTRIDAIVVDAVDASGRSVMDGTGFDDLYAVFVDTLTRGTTSAAAGSTLGMSHTDDREYVAPWSESPASADQGRR